MLYDEQHLGFADLGVSCWNIEPNNTTICVQKEIDNYLGSKQAMV